MTWRDRDYNQDAYEQQAAGTWRARRPRGATLVLMIVHAAAFVLVLMLRSSDGEAVIRLMTLEGATSHPLGILSHPLMTARLFSIVFVLLALWSLGGAVEPRLGRARFIGLYLAGNLLAGGAYLGIARTLPALAAAPLDYPVGALAGLCLTAWRALRHEPAVVFGRTTTAGKVYAVCGGIVAALVVAQYRQGAVAWLSAAATGAGVALLMERWPAMTWRRTWRIPRRVRPSIPAATPREAEPDDPDIDDLLAKISHAGLDALTPGERERLEAARLAKLHRRQ